MREANVNLCVMIGCVVEGGEVSENLIDVSA